MTSEQVDPFARLDRERAHRLRGAVANAALEGWRPEPAALQRLCTLAEGIVDIDTFISEAVDRALAAATEVGPPDAVETPQSFPDTVYPGTRVLRNRFGIRDGAALTQLEFEVGTAQGYRIEMGLADIPATYDGPHLAAIHRTLFGAVYPWAGAYRKYDMGLGHSAFHADRIERYLDDAHRLLHRRLPHGRFRRRGQRLDRLHYARLAAEAYAYLNCAHPFREGNGRASKTLLQLASGEIGYRLNFDVITKAQWDNASRLSSPDHGRYRPSSEYLFQVFTAITAQHSDDGA